MSDNDPLDYDEPSPRKSRSRSRSGSKSSSDSNSRNSRSSSESSQNDGYDGRSSISSLRAFVARDIELQTNDTNSSLDQRKLLTLIREKYKVKGLSQAYVTNSRVSPSTGYHHGGCPCDFCVAMEDTVDDEARVLINKIRGLRNWVPRGKNRPLCLLIPAALPVTGIHPPPYTFCGPLKTLQELEKAFSTGISLHPLLFSGEKANSTPALSTRWTGGSSKDEPIKKQEQLDNNDEFVIPKVSKAVSYVRDGPKSWDRFKPKESCSRPAKYVASDEAMKGALDLLSLGKTSLDKSVKDWSHEHLMLPARQFVVHNLADNSQEAGNQESKEYGGSEDERGATGGMTKAPSRHRSPAVKEKQMKRCLEYQSKLEREKGLPRSRLQLKKDEEDARRAGEERENASGAGEEDKSVCDKVEDGQKEDSN